MGLGGEGRITAAANADEDPFERGISDGGEESGERGEG